jgi:esterase/lipase superfamily enzyme
VPIRQCQLETPRELHFEATNLVDANTTMCNRLLVRLEKSMAMMVIASLGALLATPVDAQSPTSSGTPLPTEAPQNDAGEMRYGVTRVDTEVFVPISVETGNAELSAESYNRLSKLPKNAYADPGRPIEILLHPAMIEDGVVGSKGIKTELRLDKTRDALQAAWGAPLHEVGYRVHESADPIVGFGDSASVAQIRVQFGIDSTLAKVFYLTDRGTLYKDGSVSYVDSESGKLSYGFAIVNIDRHLEKPISGPWGWVTRFFEGDPPTPSADGIGTSPIVDFKHFSSVITKNLQLTGEDQVLVYIHGYRSSFDQVVQDAAMLGYLTKFPGPVIAYAWPSNTNVLDYDRDYETANRTIPRFQDFLESLRTIPGLKRINVVAHSMGSRVLFWALKGRPNLHLNELVMVAGDVAQEDFNQYFKDVRREAARFTLYSTQTDVALFFSSKIHNEARIGFSENGAAPFTLPGIDTIDATDVVKDLLSHGYQLNSDLPRTDIIYALRSDPVSKRGCLEWHDNVTKDFLHYRCR